MATRWVDGVGVLRVGGEMVWSKKQRSAGHKERSVALNAAYRSPSGLPFVDTRQNLLGQVGRRADAENRLGSRGGCAIWMFHHEGFGLEGEMPTDRQSRRCTCPDPSCKKHGFDRHRRIKSVLAIHEMKAAGDADGFAVFGRYPKGFLDHIVKQRVLGDIRREDILHVCSGTLGPVERWTVDIRHEARPLVQASGTALPFRDGCFKAVMLDPPYSDEYARNLYRTENPRPSWLLREAARVVIPGGVVAILHVAIPFAPPRCKLLRVYPVSTGVGFRIRALTVYRKEQDELPFEVIQ